MSAPITQDCKITSFTTVAAHINVGSSVLAMAHFHSELSERIQLCFDLITHMDIRVLKHTAGLIHMQHLEIEGSFQQEKEVAFMWHPRGGCLWLLL